MGYLRFRRSVKILPGVRINLNKKSTSVTFGGKGAKYTVSSTGRRTSTVGIPGTGISYTETSKKKESPPIAYQSPQNNETGKVGVGKTFLIFSGVLIFIIIIVSSI